MAISVTHDGSGRADPAENCAFCHGKTRYWYTPRDVAVCPTCAAFRSVSEVPTKAEWLAAVRAVSRS
jgi:hypothetical protein